MKTKDSKYEMLNEHFCYEIWMLDKSFKILSSGTKNQVEKNLGLECFLMHARNLYKFFRCKGKKEYAMAYDFLEEKVWSKEIEGSDKTLFKYVNYRINNEITHLTYKRKSGSAEDKI